jgi:hypothetical protein
VTLEGQVQTLVRAWPIPDRVERGEEIIATTLDLVPDGKSRLPFAMAVNLAFGGLRARWRTRPPVWRWLYYRLGGRLNARWHRWMLNDLSGPGWRRRMVGSQVTVLVIASLLGATVGQALVTHSPRFDPRYLLSLAIITMLVQAVGSNFRARKLRDRQLGRHGYLQSAQCFPSGPQSPQSRSLRHRISGQIRR